MYHDPDPPPVGWPLTARWNKGDGDPPDPAQYNDPDYFSHTRGYADPDYSRETRWVDQDYEREAKGEQIPILGDPGDGAGNVDENEYGDREDSRGSIGAQDSAEPYSRHETIDAVPSCKARRPVKPGRWDEVMIARISKPDDERRLEEREKLKIAFIALHFECQKGSLPAHEPTFGYPTNAMGLLPRQFKPVIHWPHVFSKDYKPPRTKGCQCDPPCGTVWDSPSPVSPKQSPCGLRWTNPLLDRELGFLGGCIPQSKRNGLHRTETFKLVYKAGREATEQERIAASSELSADPEFLEYMQPYPEFLKPPARRIWRWELTRASSVEPVWAINKWSSKGRRYFSEDPAEGALMLDGPAYILDKPFDAEEAEYWRLRLEGLLHREIAELLGVELQTVKNHLARDPAGISIRTVHKLTCARDVLVAATATPCPVTCATCPSPRSSVLSPFIDCPQPLRPRDYVARQQRALGFHVHIKPGLSYPPCNCVFSLCAESHDAQMTAGAGG